MTSHARPTLSSSGTWDDADGSTYNPFRRARTHSTSIIAFPLEYEGRARRRADISNDSGVESNGRYRRRRDESPTYSVPAMERHRRGVRFDTLEEDDRHRRRRDATMIDYIGRGIRLARLEREQWRRNQSYHQLESERRELRAAYQRISLGTDPSTEVNDRVLALEERKYIERRHRENERLRRLSRPRSPNYYHHWEDYAGPTILPEKPNIIALDLDTRRPTNQRRRKPCPVRRPVNDVGESGHQIHPALECQQETVGIPTTDVSPPGHASDADPIEFRDRLITGVQGKVASASAIQQAEDSTDHVIIPAPDVVFAPVPDHPRRRLNVLGAPEVPHSREPGEVRSDDEYASTQKAATVSIDDTSRLDPIQTPSSDENERSGLPLASSEVHVEASLDETGGGNIPEAVPIQDASPLLADAEVLIEGPSRSQTYETAAKLENSRPQDPISDIVGSSGIDVDDKRQIQDAFLLAESQQRRAARDDDDQDSCALQQSLHWPYQRKHRATRTWHRDVLQRLGRFPSSRSSRKVNREFGIIGKVVARGPLATGVVPPLRPPRRRGAMVVEYPKSEISFIGRYYSTQSHGRNAYCCKEPGSKSLDQPPKSAKRMTERDLVAAPVDQREEKSTATSHYHILNYLTSVSDASSDLGSQLIANVVPKAPG